MRALLNPHYLEPSQSILGSRFIKSIPTNKLPILTTFLKYDRSLQHLPSDLRFLLIVRLKLHRPHNLPVHTTIPRRNYTLVTRVILCICRIDRRTYEALLAARYVIERIGLAHTFKLIGLATLSRPRCACVATIYHGWVTAGAEHTWEVFAEERLEGGYAATDYRHVELDYAPHERGRCVVW